MVKVKNVALGDYVLATRWGDRDYADPWCVGRISSFFKTESGSMRYCVEGFKKKYRHVWKISDDEGRHIVEVGNQLGMYVYPHRS